MKYGEEIKEDKTFTADKRNTTEPIFSSTTQRKQMCK